MASPTMPMTITSRDEDGCCKFQRTYICMLTKTSGELSMLKEAEVGTMTDRSIEKLFSHWHTWCCSSPTGSQHFHGSTYNFLLSTITPNGLQQKEDHIEHYNHCIEYSMLNLLLMFNFQNYFEICRGRVHHKTERSEIEHNGSADIVRKTRTIKEVS